MTTQVTQILMADDGRAAADNGRLLVRVQATDEDFLQVGDALMIDPNSAGLPGDYVLTFGMTVEKFASQKGRRGRVCGLQRAIA